MFKKIKVIFDLSFILNCMVYSYIGIYFNYILAYAILLVEGITGAKLTDSSRIVLIVLIITMGAIPASLLFSKFKTWLFSLPVQYILYFVVLGIVSVLRITEGWDSDTPLVFFLQIPLGLLILQIPGVVVGCSIRKVTAKRHRTI